MLKGKVYFLFLFTLLLFYSIRMHKAFSNLERIASASLQAISANFTGDAFSLKSRPLDLQWMDRFIIDDLPPVKRIFPLYPFAKQYVALSSFFYFSF